MAKGQHIPPEIKRRIAKTYIKHRRLPAHTIQKLVSEEYRRDNPDAPENWPGISAVQKTLQSIRKKYLPNPKDAQWSLYTLAEFDIPAGALQSVLDCYAMTMIWNSEPLLTIREAMWVARLHRVVTDVEELTLMARACAENELINEITGMDWPGFVDADFDARARTGKPGIAYSYQGNGNYQMVIKDRRIAERIDIVPTPKRIMERDVTRSNKKTVRAH